MEDRWLGLPGHARYVLDVPIADHCDRGCRCLNRVQESFLVLIIGDARAVQGHFRLVCDSPGPGRDVHSSRMDRGFLVVALLAGSVFFATHELPPYVRPYHRRGSKSTPPMSEFSALLHL